MAVDGAHGGELKPLCIMAGRKCILHSWAPE